MALTPTIITLADIRAVRPVSNNIDTTTITPYIREAQDQDLKTLLGDPFYKAFVDDINGGSPSAENLELFEGGDYVVGGETIYFRGVNEYLSYCAFSRFVTRNNSQTTRYGVVTKQTEESLPVTSADRSQERNDAGAVANSIAIEITNFLNENSSLYPLWNKKDRITTNKSIRFFQPRRVQIP